MNERVHKSLYDIKFAIEEIDEFFQSKQQSFEIYKQDILLKRGIERNLEIIGEAMSRILRDDPDCPVENSRRIISLRNQIIHGYDNVSDENIWSIVVNHLPQLKIDVEKLIQDYV